VNAEVSGAGAGGASASSKVFFDLSKIMAKYKTFWQKS